MPPPLVRLFMDDKKLGLRVWCTFLATVRDARKITAEEL